MIVVSKELLLLTVQPVLPVHKVRRVVLVLPVNPDKTVTVPVMILKVLVA